jgi:hypothetical protein
MAKAKKLTAEQYWQWRFLIAQMWNAENKELARKYQAESMNKDAVVSGLRAQLFASRDVQHAASEKEAMQKQYREYKEQLEQTLGISLNGVTIDDVTFEIKTIDL